MKFSETELPVLRASRKLAPPFLQEQFDQLDEAHTRTQAALTQGSQNSEQIIAEDSGHYIHFEQPDLVIDAIHQVVDAARNGSSI